MLKARNLQLLKEEIFELKYFQKLKLKFSCGQMQKFALKEDSCKLKKKGQKTSLKRIYDEIVARDMNDLNRKIAPLKPAVNSVLLDTSYLDIEQAFNVIKKIIS